MSSTTVATPTASEVSNTETAARKGDGLDMKQDLRVQDLGAGRVSARKVNVQDDQNGRARSPPISHRLNTETAKLQADIS